MTYVRCLSTSCLVLLLLVVPALARDESQPAQPGQTPPESTQVDSSQPAEREARTLSGRLPVLAPGPVSTDQLREVTDEAREGVKARWEKLLRGGTHPAGPSLRYEQVDPSKLRALNPPISFDPQAQRADKAYADFTLFRNTSLSSVIGTSFRSTTNEPSVAAAGDRVFFTWNWWAADSSNQGASFSSINPFTGPFSPVNSGFCCDQLTIHDPASNTLFFLQQYIEDGTSGTQRINVDQNTDGTFDCAIDVTPQGLGFGPGDWADFPDLAVGDNYLYHSSNVFDASFEGAFVARYSLADLASCASSVTFDVYTDPDDGSFRLTQGATDTVWFAAQFSLSSVTIWSWPEASGSPTSVLRSVTSWANAGRTCAGPDGRDWCGFIDFRILGGSVQGDQIVFLWTPSQDASHPFPYTRIARFAQSGLSLTSEFDFYSTDYAIVYAAAAPNERGHVGGIALFGGGTTFYPSCMAWIVDDITGSPDFSNLEVTTVALGSSGPLANRSGDYLNVRPHSSHPDTWVASCFSYPSTGTSDPRFVWFGRDRSDPATSLHWDGFESGDFTYWSFVQ